VVTPVVAVTHVVERGRYAAQDHGIVLALIGCDAGGGSVELLKHL